MTEVKIPPALIARNAMGSASSAGSDGIKIGSDAGLGTSSVVKAKTEAELLKPALALVDPVSQAVADLNTYVQNEQRDLLFSVDDESGEMVVRVLDRESGELIRQIPNEVVLELANKAKMNEPLQLIDMHG